MENKKKLQRVYEEVVQIARRYQTVDYDEEEGTWVCIPEFPMPKGWNKVATALMFELPSNYPHMPPDGFYIDQHMKKYGSLMIPYFENNNRHNRYADRGWAWFCLHLNKHAWRPKTNILAGDSLLTLASTAYVALEKV